jgi:uncharacterized protein (TIRG00374 family)
VTPPPAPPRVATSTAGGSPGRASRERSALPREFESRHLIRRAIQVAAIIGVLVLIALLAPGLGEVRKHLGEAKPAWIAVAVGLELLSCISYVLMFRPVFCRQMSWKSASQIGWSELAMGSIVPASGAAGLALGAWALIEGGMEPERVARRSVAFFLIKSSVNFVAVAVIGTAVALGLFGPDLSLWLTAFPAALSLLVIAGILLLPRLGEGRPAPEGASKLKRGIVAARRSVIAGTREAIGIVKAGDPLVLVGALGYWVWDNAVLWATFHAFGADVDISIILLGYLIGQLGGLLPIPGGIGGIDGGLIGTLIVFGAPAAATAAAVLVYRVILFWLPLVFGAFAFVSLRRRLAREEEDIFAPC